jgi:phage terminase large subunit-like protein
LGTVLDPWQELVLEAAMGERADGRWAARHVAVSTPRQNGKSQLIVARAMAGILLFNEQMIIASAHQQDTAREVFNRILDIIEVYPAVGRRVDGVIRAVGREQIRFKSGQMIKLKARGSGGGGRGFSCDCLLLDEAQILSATTWGDILPTMSARPNPQAWLLGTPPKDGDDGGVFGRQRALGIEGREPGRAYLEWAAEPDDPIEDPATWAKANAAYGTRIEYDAVATELASMNREQFQMERLGIWPESANTPIVTEARWREMISAGPADGVKPTAFGVDMSHARDISVGACWIDDTGAAYVEEVWANADTVATVEWIVAAVAAAGRRTPVVVDPYSAASLIPELRSRGVSLRVVQPTGAEMAQGCGTFEAGVTADTLSHADQPRLADAIAGAKRRPIRDTGGWGWDRRNTGAQIHPIVAVTLALFGASSVKRRKTRDRKAVVLS